MAIPVWFVLERDRPDIHAQSLVFILEGVADSLDKIKSLQHGSYLFRDIQASDVEFKDTVSEDIKNCRFLGFFNSRADADAYMYEQITVSLKEYAVEIEKMPSRDFLSVSTKRAFAIYQSQHKDFPIEGYYSIYMDDYKYLLSRGIPVRIATSAELQPIVYIFGTLMIKNPQAYEFAKTNMVQWIPILSTIKRDSLVSIQKMIRMHIAVWNHTAVECYKIAQLERSQDSTEWIKRNTRNSFMTCASLAVYINLIDEIVDQYRNLFKQNPDYFLDRLPSVPPMFIQDDAKNKYEITFW